MMKPKPDFNIYIINDNADDETKTRFQLGNPDLFCVLLEFQPRLKNLIFRHLTGFQYLHY
jgi:hypothetical protein